MKINLWFNGNFVCCIGNESCAGEMEHSKGTRIGIGDLQRR